jgi:hypothetical protein
LTGLDGRANIPPSREGASEVEARPEGPTLRGLRIRADVVQILLACGLGLFAVEIITFLRSVALIDRLQRSCLAFATCSPSDQTA